MPWQVPVNRRFDLYSCETTPAGYDMHPESEPIGLTPSLICRYTCGRNLGSGPLKFRPSLVILTRGHQAQSSRELASPTRSTPN